MRVNPNSGLSEVTGTPRQTTAQSPSLGQDQLALSSADALNSALDQTPAVRPDKAASAKRLLSDTTYPPDEVINALARLLAVKLQASQQSQGAQNQEDTGQS
jgi:hypothetical protein